MVHAQSPYLQQHATNPLDWWQWGRRRCCELVACHAGLVHLPSQVGELAAPLSEAILASHIVTDLTLAPHCAGPGLPRGVITACSA
ncbi:hypothetical protein [Streptomyces sp. NPDC004296]|uniref:hypothetical protein n=1 Tax=Streptomyces sp. NPDC004296 TaxID=3364697 RepID=UPI00369F432F